MNSFSIEYHSTKLWINPVAYNGRNRLLTDPATSALVMDQACGRRVALILMSALHRRSGG